MKEEPLQEKIVSFTLGPFPLNHDYGKGNPANGPGEFPKHEKEMTSLSHHHGNLRLPPTKCHPSLRNIGIGGGYP